MNDAYRSRASLGDIRCQRKSTGLLLGSDVLELLPSGAKLHCLSVLLTDYLLLLDRALLEITALRRCSNALLRRRILDSTFLTCEVYARSSLSFTDGGLLLCGLCLKLSALRHFIIASFLS